MNRSAWKIAVCLLLAVGAGRARAGVTRVTVVGERVNLRAKDSLKSEVVHQVMEGATLYAKSFQGEWVEVVPPEAVDFYVHRDFVEHATVRTRKLNVRAGPGINFSVVGALSRGDTVTVRGEFNEWLKIAPPSVSSLWISRQFVETARPQIRKRKSTPAPVSRRPTPVRTPEPVSRTRQPAQPTVQPTPAAGQWKIPADWKLVPLEGQGKRAEREGVLKPVGFLIGRPSRHRLVEYDGSRIRTICFLRGDEEQMNSWLGERLVIRGREYWLQGRREPVLVVEQIIARPHPAPAQSY